MKVYQVVWLLMNFDRFKQPRNKITTNHWFKSKYSLATIMCQFTNSKRHERTGLDQCFTSKMNCQLSLLAQNYPKIRLKLKASQSISNLLKEGRGFSQHILTWAKCWLKTVYMLIKNRISLSYSLCCFDVTAILIWGLS